MPQTKPASKELERLRDENRRLLNRLMWLKDEIRLIRSTTHQAWDNLLTEIDRALEGER